MSAVASSNPLSTPFWTRTSNYSLFIGPAPRYSRGSWTKICCTINIDTEKIQRLLNTKGKPKPKPQETWPGKKIRRKENDSYFQKKSQNFKRNAVEGDFAEDSSFKAAFGDYIKAMDNVKRIREDQKKSSEEKEQHKELIEEESNSSGLKSERKNLKPNYREGKEKRREIRADFRRKVRFKEFSSKNFKLKKADFEGDEKLDFKREFRVGRESMREFVKDSLDLNAKVGLMVNVERGVDSGAVETLQRSGRLAKSEVNKFGSGKLGDVHVDADVKDGIRAENKAFKFCTEREPPADIEDRIRQLAQRLNEPHTTMSMWKFSELMYSSKIKFTDYFLNRLVQVLGDIGNWRQALQVIEWIRSRERYKSSSSRYIYTTVLSILGKAGRPVEALNVFHAMREEFSTYPDMPAYHSIAVTLGQAGFIKEILDLMDCMQAGPEKKLENVPLQHWNPCLQPDLVIYNALINACVPHKEWQGAVWTLQQIRHSGIKPNSATYGLVMKVMLKSGKYDLVHEIFERMEKSGMIPNALTYKALVQACWKEGKIDKAVVIVGEMERRGVVGTASLYYELACCLCSAGRCQDALLQVEKIRRVAKKPLYVTYTGLIKACNQFGHLQDCISIFDHMQKSCAPNIITCNMMLKLYGQNYMFKEAKSLFESIKRGRVCPQNVGDSDPLLVPDIITYTAMLEACVVAQEWYYFEDVYQDMLLTGYQLENKQHSLLVAASRAGKGHLLKNAYEKLVKLGRIPHVSMYKELICYDLQAGDHGKTLEYVRSMACAKLNMRKSEWMELFEKNSDRISKENLQGLLKEVNSFSGENDQTNIILKTFINCLQLITEQWTHTATKFQIETVAATN